MLKYFIFFTSLLFAQNTLAIDSKIIAKDLERPLLVRFEPETNFMYIIQQTGEIFIKTGSDTILFLDWSEHITVKPMPDERGLLGMAFDPNFKKMEFFIYHMLTPKIIQLFLDLRYLKVGLKPMYLLRKNYFILSNPLIIIMEAILNSALLIIIFI